MTAPLVDLKNVFLTLQNRAGPVEILRGIDFQMAEREVVGIVGPSGSGKTSLLMIMAGLEQATSGTVHVAGKALNDLNEDALATFRRDAVGIIFQSFHLIPTMTALENVAVPLEFRGSPDAFAVARSGLARVGLEHRFDHFPGQLSGGEQQRVAIARALACGARLILADEPTGNLDQATGQSIMDLLFSVRDEDGTGLVLITHDATLAARCDRMVCVRDGRIEHAVSGAGKTPGGHRI